jgi:branched-chain amino acid transport system permease protein
VYSLLAAAVVAAVVPLVANEYYLSVLIFGGLYAVMALGLNLLVGYTGQLSFGHNAFVGIGAYASAILTTRYGVPAVVALVVVCVATAVVAVAIGYPTLRLRGHYLAMGTAAWGVIGYAVFSQMEEVTNGFSGISGIPFLTLGPVTFDSAVKFFYLTWTVLLVTVLACRRLVNSRAGRALRAIRSDEVAARSSGIRTTGYRVQVFVLSAVLAAGAGSLFAHWVTYISPEPFAPGLAIQLLVFLFAGGIGTQWGPVVGAVVLTAVGELTSAYQGYSQLFFSVLLVVMLIFAPRGIVGEIAALRQRWTGGKPAPMAPAIGRESVS